MIFFRSSLVALFLVAIFGCAPKAPMTAAEFSGNCRQFAEGEERSCDTVVICNSYLTAINMHHRSQQACLSACKDTDAPLRRAAPGGCLGAYDYANDWCQRYCRSVYPQ